MHFNESGIVFGNVQEWSYSEKNDKSFWVISITLVLSLEKSYKIFNNPILPFLQEEKVFALEQRKFDARKCNKFQQVSNKGSRKRTLYSQTTQFQAQRV
jgi:hypothetical protein